MIAGRDTISFILFCILQTTIALPCLQLPHISGLSGQMRLVIAASAIALLVANNFGFVPVCHLYSRGRALNSSLFNLHAHITEIMPLARGLSRCHHALWLLHKELRHPTDMINKFSVLFFNTPLTYSSVMKVHFWLGVALIIILKGQSPTRDSTFGLVGLPKF